MKIIVSGILSIIGLFLIFIINLSKGRGIARILISPFIGAIVIFGVAFGVLFLLSKILNINSILAESREENEEAHIGTSSPNLGSTVNYVVQDDEESSENISNEEDSADLEKNVSQTEKSGDLPEITADLDGGELPNIEVDQNNGESGMLEGGSIEENSTVEEMEASNHAFQERKSTAGMAPEEIIKEKIGIAASPEDIAKAIRTTVKRQGGLDSKE